MQTPLSSQPDAMPPLPGAGLLQYGTGLHRLVTVLLCLIGFAATAQPCTDTAQGPQLQSVLPGIDVVHGHWPAQHPLHPDHHATTVVLWSGKDATVVDPGPTLRWGRALQQLLRCKRQLRTVLVLNTHAHAENVLANGAMSVPVAATAITRSAMRQRCPDCLAALQHDLGAVALSGTGIALPQRTLVQGDTLRAGGRDWQILDMREAHTASDLVLWSAPEGIVLAGPLLDARRLVLAQGSVRGWLQALAQIEALHPQWLIGQHLVAGPGQVQQTLSTQRQALCQLVRQAWQGLDRGWSEAEALQLLPQALTDSTSARQHRFNLLRTWREMEGLWLEHQPMPSACVESGS